MLSDEVGPLVRFGVGVVVRLRGETACHPCEVVRQCAYGLHTLRVQLRLAFRRAIDDVPVLRGGDGHVAHLKGHVHRLERRRGTSSARHDNARDGLEGKDGPCGIKYALQHRQERAVGLAEIGRRAEKEGIGILRRLNQRVGDIVIKRAAQSASPRTCSTGGAASDGPVAYMEKAGVKTLFPQDESRLRQRGKRVAVLARGAVDKENFHIFRTD